MSRTITSAVQTEIVKPTVSPAIFVEAQFVSGLLNVWSGIGPITWNAKTWTGVGSLGNITPNSETTAVEARNFSMSLSGIPNDLVGKALADCRPTYPCTVWVAFLDSTGAVIPDPVLSAKGLMDVPVVEENGLTSSITIAVENRLVDLGRSRERRYTDQDHQQLYPGDSFLSRVVALQQKNLSWGKDTNPTFFGWVIAWK